MGVSIPNLIGTAALFLLIFVSGFWLRGRGRPYGSLGLNLHKFISLGALALLIVTLVRAGRATGLDGAETAVWAVTGVFFLGAIVSGGLMSALKSPPAGVRVLHWAAPICATLGAGGALYLLARKGVMKTGDRI
jgi:hypothetical protein